MSNKFDEMELHRVGRLTFSLPEEFVQLPESFGEFRTSGVESDVPAINFNLAALNISRDEFTAKVDAAVQKLSQEEKNSGMEYLADTRILGKKLLQIRVGIIGQSYRSEIHALIGDTYVIGSLESFHDNYETAEKQLRQFMAGVLPSTKGIDDGKGFCVGPVIVTGNFSRE